MVNLDRKAAAPRLVQLLQFPRPEVFVAAAWGLQAGGSRDVAGSIREVERRLLVAKMKVQRVPNEMIDEELAQLCESLGRAKFGQCRAGVKAVHS